MIANIHNAQNEIAEAIKLCLLSERASTPSERLAGKGWWGDFFSDVELGSDLWRLERSVLSKEALQDAEIYASYCLRWLLDRKILKSLQIKAYNEQSNLILEIQCVQA